MIWKIVRYRVASCLLLMSNVLAYMGMLQEGLLLAGAAVTILTFD
jgi:hypothetical protein